METEKEVSKGETDGGSKSSKSGAASVNGSLSGLAAGMVMIIYLIITAWISSASAASVLSRFGLGANVSPAVGGISHMAVSAIYGAMFGLVAQTINRRIPPWLSGLIYGLLLYSLARFILLPQMGSPLMEIPASHFAAAHVIYGLILGVLTSRKGS